MSDNIPYRPRESNDDGSRGDDNEDEEEEINEAGYKTVRDAVLFAIEVSESMVKTPPRSKTAEATSPLLAALQCAYHLMQQRIISSPKDLMGILLYGTEASKFYDEDENLRGGWSFPHCYLLTDLDVPEAEDVKALKRLVSGDSPDAEHIFRPAEEAVPMHNVLFCANQIFQQRAANFTSRRLFIVTDNDNPHARNKAFRSQATVRAKDLYDLGVIIELFPISTPDHTFDTKLFYDDIVYRSTPSDPDAIPYSLADSGVPKLKADSAGGGNLLQSLLSTITSKVTPKRALFSSVPLELAPGLRISVKGYLLYKHQMPARSSYIYLGGERPEIVKGQTQQVASDSTHPVEKGDIQRAYTFGGERITFSDDEVKKLRDFGDPVIRIIGFKPMTRLPLWANIKNSTFLYPSEEDSVGSTRVLSALHRKLLQGQLFGLCWVVPRRNAVPVMAALVPTLSAKETEEKANPAGISATGAPQGLHLIPLPFADDIRENPPTTQETPLRAPDELIDAMRPIIQQLNLPKGIYDPSRYPNPSLQWHYRILQALALDEDIPATPEDKTKPKYRQIDKRVGNEATEWGRILETTFKQYQAEHGGSVGAGAKRTTNGQAPAAAGGVSKKIKTEPGDVVTEEAMRKLWQKSQIAALTVAQLRDFCAVKKIPVVGKKADIVERIEAWFEQK